MIQRLDCTPPDDFDSVPTHGTTAWPRKPESDLNHADSINTIRRRRWVFTWSSLGFLIGTLLITFNSPWREEIIAPGPLSSAHAQALLAHDNRCAACHAAASQTFAQWVRALFPGGWARRAHAEHAVPPVP